MNSHKSIQLMELENNFKQYIKSNKIFKTNNINNQITFIKEYIEKIKNREKSIIIQVNLYYL